jgi:hypothetical protein
MSKNTYILNFGRSDNMGYDFVGSLIKGEFLNITIKNIPVNATPWTWQWEMRESVAYVNGLRNWQTGTLIQTDNGTLATASTTSLVIQAPIPINASQFDLGKQFSFNFVLNPGTPTVGIEVYFEVGSVSSNPTSSGLLGQGVYDWSGPNSFKKMVTGDLSLINNGAGFDLTTLTNGGLFNSSAINLAKIFINGQEVTSDQYSFFSTNKFKFLAGTVVYKNDVVDFYYPLSTFAKSGTVSGYGTIQDEGVALTSRAKMNFTGNAVVASDDNTNNRTNIAINQIQSDWNASSGLAVILNKPTIPSLMLFVMTANSTAVANTVASTTILGTGVGTLTLPANFFVAGKTVIIKGHAVISTTATPTLTLRSYLGATLIVSTTTTTLGTLANNGIDYEIQLTCRTTGGSGTIRGKITYWCSGNVIATSGSGATTVDTTVSQTIDVQALWGTASASNTITGDNCYVQILN